MTALTECKASLVDYLAEIKTLTKENEKLQINLAKAKDANRMLEIRIRRLQDFAAILAARADAAGMQED